MNKSVLFLHRLGPQFASYRYRAEMPALEVAKLNGFKTGLNTPGEYDVIVVSKPVDDDFPVVERAKKEGCKIVVDCSDDHFGDSQAETYRKMAGLADHLVTATDVMRNRVTQYLKRDAVVIPDPYEQPESEPHAEGNNFLWFGHSVNLAALTNVTQQLKNRSLMVVTGPKAIQNTTPWNKENMTLAFKESNIALFPTLSGAENKSANRLINSLRAGCFAVCMDHPSYDEFRDFVWVGHFRAGLKWTDAFKSDLNELVKAGQDYIRDRYSPQTIGTQWAKMLESV